MSASETGVLVYRSAASLQLTWVDRQGRIAGRMRERGMYQSVELSPDGARAIVSRASPRVSSDSELWVFDFAREMSTRLTSVMSDEGVWSRDGTRILFAREGGLFQRVLTTQTDEAVMPSSAGRKSPTSWSPDGRFVLYTIADSRTASDIWAVSMEGERASTPFLRSPAAESQGQFSPNPERPLLVAYTSNESGRDEVVVRTFPDGGNVQVVSTSGGHSPRWRGDGRALLYIGADGTVMAVPIDAAGHAGAPAALFPVPGGFGSRDATQSRASAPWAVTPDGQRFLFAVPERAGGLAQFTVVVNWRPGVDR
jgi:Tol biopolymer transport system component